MPSQEDYLDKLLKNMEKIEEPEIETESEEQESNTAIFDIPEDTESEFLSENVEDLLEDAVSDLEGALGLEGDLDLNELLEQDANSGLGVNELPDPMDMEAAAVLEELLPETDLPETDALLEDAVADLETVLGTENSMDYSATDEQAVAEADNYSNFDWEEVDIDFEDSIDGAEETILSAQEEENGIEQEQVEMPAMMDIPESVEEPAMMDMPELTEESDVTEVPEPVEEPDVTEVSESVEEPDVMEVPEPVEEPDLMEVPEPVEEPDVMDIPEPVEEPAMMDMPESIEEPAMMDVPEFTEEPAMMEVPESVEEPDIMDVSELSDLSDLSDTMDVAEAIELMEAMEEPEPAEIPGTAPDLEAVSTMSEDEIEQFLSASAGEDQIQTSAEKESAEEIPDEDTDLMGLLGDTEDSDLLDIQDMLDKADNNEAVSEEIEALLQGTAIPDAPIEEGVTEIEDEKSKRAQDKKRKRQEKAAAKKAAKEAKAAAKEAAKEGVSVPTPSEQTKQTEKTDSPDTLFDSELLDSIVSGADQAGLEETGQQEESDGGADDGLEFDMDSLFGDGDDSSLGSDTADLSDNDAFPDFIGLKKEDDNLVLPEMETEGKKKKGLLARFFDMLTEEDEDEESESLQLSDENKEILNDLDKEKTAGKKKKKKKKAAPGQDDEEDAEGGKGKKAKKPKKPKREKPKKEKAPEPEPLIPEKKLTPKKVIPVLLVCASLGVLLVVFTNASVDYTDKKTAHDAYYEGDYQTCYENLFGKELNETEQIMFGTSESILRIRLWLKEYEMFVEADEEVEALDSLIQTVNDYPELYAYAVQFNAGDEVIAAYTNILNILYAKYGLTEAQAQEIAAVRSNYTYTQMVVDIVLGKPFGSWNEPEDTEPTPETTPLPDELPEEGELSVGSFINNQ